VETTVVTSVTFIPFLPRFHDAIRLGVKTMTARTKRYGEPGDVLQSKGFQIQLLEVRRVRLGDVAERHFIEEGCEDPADFMSVWKMLHPRKGFLPDLLVWLHVFRIAG
jgi:hypothetical protein